MEAALFDSSGKRREAHDLEQELTDDLEHHIFLCMDVDALMVSLSRTLPPVPADVPTGLPSGKQSQAIEHLKTYISNCGGDAGNHGFDAVCFSGSNSSLNGHHPDRWAIREKPDGAIYKTESGCDAEKKTVGVETGGKQKTVKKLPEHCWEEIEIPVEVTAQQSDRPPSSNKQCVIFGRSYPISGADT